MNNPTSRFQELNAAIQEAEGLFTLPTGPLSVEAKAVLANRNFSFWREEVVSPIATDIYESTAIKNDRKAR